MEFTDLAAMRESSARGTPLVPVVECPPVAVAQCLSSVCRRQACTPASRHDLPRVWLRVWRNFCGPSAAAAVAVVPLPLPLPLVFPQPSSLLCDIVWSCVSYILSCWTLPCPCHSSSYRIMLWAGYAQYYKRWVHGSAIVSRDSDGTRQPLPLRPFTPSNTTEYNFWALSCLFDFLFLNFLVRRSLIILHLLQKW